MDITNSRGLNETEADRDGHSKEESKLLNPTKELNGEMMSLIEWQNRNFYGGELAPPFVTFRTDLKTMAMYVAREVDHKSGTLRPGFRLNPFLFMAASFQTQCMELLGLMEHQRQGKAKRTNYHDLDYAAGMKKHGIQTHSAEDPDKEIGERIMLSIVAGGKFERLVAKKQESGFAFTWAFHEKEPVNGEAAMNGGAKPESKSGRKFKYECSCEGCPTSFWGKDGQKGGCFEHDPPVKLVQVD